MILNKIKGPFLRRRARILRGRARKSVERNAPPTCGGGYGGGGYEGGGYGRE